MIKEYKTISEVAGPLMLVKDVENVAFDELGIIELPSGETRSCRVLEINGSNAIPWERNGTGGFRRYARTCI